MVRAPYVLVVDDDPAMQTWFRRALTAAGYRVQGGKPGGAVEKMTERPFDLMLLDIDSPRGPETVRIARELSAAPIVVLSSDEDIAVDALDEGADDYVRKPFRTKELLARIKNALRRKAQQEGKPARLVVGDVEIDLLFRRVSSRGRQVHLPVRAYQVLKVLAEAGGKVLTHEEIRRIWDACDTQNSSVSAWFRLRLVTAQRGGELLQMRWQDIDGKSNVWSIPAEYVKNAHGHRVYLNELARKVLATVPRDETRPWVFPKSFMGDYKHVGRRLAQRTRANIIAEAKAAPRTRDKADIRGHDLRRTAASLMASGGVPRFLISRILNHSEEKDVTSVYDRYSYDAEKKAAMAFWNRQLAAILRGNNESIGRFKMSAR